MLLPPDDDLIVQRPEGLYCPPGGFFIDPWRPVERAVITHAHADHARRGHVAYLTSASGAGVLRARLGGVALQTLAYGERLAIGDTTVSLHPAGHVLGSAQVRVEHRGRVWVASGDYYCDDHDTANATCEPFEAVRCECFITESTFGLPIYRWRPQQEVMAAIGEWWRANAAQGRASLLLGYSFGKAQRLLAGVDAAIGPIFVHGAVEPLSVLGSSWTQRLGDHSDAFASGWMQLRGARRRQGLDRGFVLSDHADWPGLQRAIIATGAQRVIVTHGYEAVMVRWLQQRGLQAESFRTEFGDETTGEPPA